MNSAISSLTFMFRTEIQEVIDMELKNYTIEKVFCQKNSTRETESGVCSEGRGKVKAFFSDEEKHQYSHAKIRRLVVDFISLDFGVGFF